MCGEGVVNVHHLLLQKCNDFCAMKITKVHSNMVSGGIRPWDCNPTIPPSTNNVGNIETKNECQWDHARVSMAEFADQFKCPATREVSFTGIFNNERSLLIVEYNAVHH